VSSIEPRGLSGGAIIDSGRPSDPRVFREELLPIPRLIGMTIERWKEHQVLVGTRLAVILPEIYTHFVNRPRKPDEIEQPNG
jgi:hypothetical protein